MLLRETQRVPILPCNALEQDEVAADVYRRRVSPLRDEAVGRKPDPGPFAALQAVKDAREELPAL